MRIKSKVWIGSVFCILSACLWGVSGAVGQYLFNQAGISPEWLVSARCLLTGLLLLVFYQVKHGGVFSIWMDRQDRIGIIIFALGGMLFMQYGYFAAIAHSNAATATVLQYTAPVLIVVYLAFREKKLPTKLECIAVFGCLVGTILLATHGNLKSLSLSPQALFWGALSSIALAFYTVYPVRLLAKYDAMLLIGWSILVLSFVMHFVHPSWDYAGNWNTSTVLAMVFIVIFGTTIPYLMFLNGVKYIGPTKSSLLQLFHHRGYGRRTCHNDFAFCFGAFECTRIALTDVSVFLNNCLPILAQNEVDEILGHLADLLACCNIEGSCDCVGAVFNIFSRCFDLINGKCLYGIIQGAEGNITDSVIIACYGCHHNGCAVCDFRCVCGVVDFFTCVVFFFNAEQLDKCASCAGAILTGNNRNRAVCRAALCAVVAAAAC